MAYKKLQTSISKIDSLTYKMLQREQKALGAISCTSISPQSPIPSYSV